MYTTVDGLAHNLVNRIHRDARGFVWFCTREGLSRFDGRGFVNYGVADGLPSAVINDIVELPNGTYWLATARGLVLFDPAGRKDAAASDQRRPMFTTYKLGESAETQYVTAAIVDHDGRVWAGTHGGLYRAGTAASSALQFTSIDLSVPGTGITSVVLAKDNVLWIGTASGLYRWSAHQRLERYDGKLFTGTIAALAWDDSGTLWVGTTGGLSRLVVDPASGRILRHRTFTEKDGLHTNWVSQIVRTTDGQLWVVTTGGLSRADGQDPPSFHRYDLGQPAFNGLLSMAEDAQRYLWVGTMLGLLRVSISGFSIFDARAGVPNAGAIFTTPRHGVLVMGADAEWRLSRLDGQRFVPIRMPLAQVQAGWGWNQVTLLDREGDWWTGSRQGIFRFRGLDRLEEMGRVAPTYMYTRRNGLPNDVVLRLFEDSRGDIWASTVGEGVANGVARWNRATNTWSQIGSTAGFPSLARYYASSFAETAGGDVWIGFSGEAGLVRYRDGAIRTFAARDGVPGGAIRNLLVDARGVLWAASYRSGLVRVESPGDDVPRFRTWNTSSGLSSNEVTALAEDLRGRIYAGTARGIDRLDPVSGAIKTYTETGGLLGEFQAAARDRDGTLWFSCSAGVIRFVPEEEQKRAATPTLITGLRVSGRAREISATGESLVDELRFPAGTSPLEIDFVAPLGASGDERYQVMLDGADETWSTPSAQRSVTYARLVPGRYRFLVRAVDSDGTVGPPATFPFTVLSPVWMRWWFIAITGAGGALALYAVYHRRVARLRAIAGIRSRIASDLHDDIGANLTRISVLSEVVRRQGVDGGQADIHLASIGRVARESVTTMSDIIWAIKPHDNDLHELGRKMREYAEEMCAATDVRVTFDLPDGRRGSRLGPDRRRDLYLVFKEAVNNAVRHADCTELRVALHRDHRRIVLEVIDDGRGFDPSQGSRGNGLTNMQQRAERLHGKLTTESGPRRGTTISLELPDRPRTTYPVG